MLILLAIVLCVGANGYQWAPFEIPDPVKNFSLCGRFAPSHICNPDGIISNDTANWFDSDLVAGKLQVGTLWIGNVTALPMADFSSMVFNSWGIGDPVMNDGVLLVVAVGNRTIYIRVGAGVVSKFTDSVIAGIITSMKNQVSHGYDQMLRTGTEAILTTLGGTSTGSSSSSGSGSAPGGAKNSGPLSDTALFLIVFFSVGGVSILCVVIVSFMSNVSKNREENRERENYHTRVSAPVAPVAANDSSYTGSNSITDCPDTSSDFFGSDVKSSDDFFEPVEVHSKSQDVAGRTSHKKVSSKSRNSTQVGTYLQSYAKKKTTPQRKYYESSSDRETGYNYGGGYGGGGGGYDYGGGGGGNDYGGGGGGGNVADYGGGNDTGGGGGGGGWD